MARMVAAWSKDPSTKVGAVAVRDRRPLVSGYNGLPTGVRSELRCIRSKKRNLFERSNDLRLAFDDMQPMRSTAHSGRHRKGRYP